MRSTYTVEKATSADLRHIAGLRAAEHWAVNAWLLEAVHAWAGGQFFIARSGGAEIPADLASETPPLAAAVSATAYGEIGFIGNVIVHPLHRGTGLGQLVMRAALDWLASRAVRFVELDATEHGRPLYTRLGFVVEHPSWHVRAPLAPFLTSAVGAIETGVEIVALHPPDVARIAHLDREALGGDRLELLSLVLRQAGSHGWLAVDRAGKAHGYVVVRPLDHDHVGLRVGPWVARSPEDAAMLLRHAVTALGDAGVLSNGPGSAISAAVPGASAPVLDFYRQCQLPLSLDDVRMRLVLRSPAERTSQTPETKPSSSSTTPRSDWVYAMLAPMVG